MMNVVYYCSDENDYYSQLKRDMEVGIVNCFVEDVLERKGNFILYVKISEWIIFLLLFILFLVNGILSD